ncbi:MAG: DMT family transporter [Cyanobacteria bacterium P01_G01_bin.19]
MPKNSLLNSEQEASKIAPEVERSPLLADFIYLGILAIAIVALAFSPIFTKLSEIEISPTATIFNRLWIATIIMAGWQLIKSPKGDAAVESEAEEFEFNSNYGQQALLVSASVCATVSSLLWAISFTQTSVASSTVLRSLTPLFISLGAWLILKQQFNRQFLVGMAIAIAGGIAIGWGDVQIGRGHLIGDGIALLSAALHGANILIVGYLRDRRCTTTKILLWRCSFGAAIALPIVWLTGSHLFPVSVGGWLTVIALAVVCQTFGQGLLVFSLRQFSSSFVGIFALLKPLFTAILAWIIFTESLSIVSIIALVLILFGIYLAKSTD